MTRIASMYDLFTTRVLDRFRDPLLLALRIFIGWQFFITGKGKLGNIERVVGYFGSLGIPMPEVTARFVATLETVGGLLLLLGLATRLIAIPLSINMVVAYVTADRAALMNADAFTSAAEFPFLLISLVVLAFGAGVFSLDGLIRRGVRPHKVPGAAMAALGLIVIGAALPIRAATVPPPRPEVATFSMGCFWCAEEAFDGVPGVVKVLSGYTGGTVQNPTYEEVSGGGTGHRESVEVTFDPSKISYEKLLDIFWHNVDPLDPEGQFCDKGPQYRSAIFYHDEAQRRAAQASYAAVQKRFGRIYTDVIPASRFWPAEEYHQQYAKKNPVRYHFYRYNCGRDARLKEIWK